jgi:hypothetical protein
MSDEAIAKLPRYLCHKVVQAMKFNEMEFRDGGALLRPEDATLIPVQVDQAFLDKHKPQAPGYFVVYEDGYKSFSPVATFEAGYTLLTGAKADVVDTIKALLEDGVIYREPIDNGDRHRAADEVAKLP